MTNTTNANAARTNMIDFPAWVEVTKCATIPHSVTKFTYHGTVKTVYHMPVWMM